MRSTSPDKLLGQAAITLFLLVFFVLLVMAGKPPVKAGGSSALSRAVRQSTARKTTTALFMFDPPAGNRTYLAKFYENGSGRVALYELGVPAAHDAMAGTRRFPAFVPDRYREALVRWTAMLTSVKESHTVTVKQHCWPVFAKYAGLASDPLLELSSVYPGGTPAPGRPVNSLDTLNGSIETDPGLAMGGVLTMLGRIEAARENGTLDVYLFDGHETVAQVDRRAPVSRPETLSFVLNGWGFNLVPKEEPKPLFAANRLLTLGEGSVRGKLPPAIPVSVVNRGKAALPRVALTIDDGWDADMRILDLMSAWKIRFTAFPIGEYVSTPQGRELVRRVYAMGGEVCSHTWSHRTMRGMTEPVLLSEIWRSTNEISNLTHEVFPYVRFSGGDYDVPAVNIASREGFWVVNWTIDTLDTKKGLTTDQRVASVLGSLKPGAIILCHWGGYQTYDILARIIPEIQKRGYEVTTLSRVLEGTPFRLNR